METWQIIASAIVTAVPILSWCGWVTLTLSSISTTVRMGNKTVAYRVTELERRVTDLERQCIVKEH